MEKMINKVTVWINVLTVIYKKTLKQSMTDKKVDDKDANEIEKLYNLCLDKRTDIMKSTLIIVEIAFCDLLNKDSLSPDKITEYSNFLVKMMSDVNIIISIDINLYKPRKENIKIEMSDPPESSNF